MCANLLGAFAKVHVTESRSTEEPSTAISENIVLTVSLYPSGVLSWLPSLRWSLLALFCVSPALRNTQCYFFIKVISSQSFNFSLTFLSLEHQAKENRSSTHCQILGVLLLAPFFKPSALSSTQSEVSPHSFCLSLSIPHGNWAKSATWLVPGL